MLAAGIAGAGSGAQGGGVDSVGGDGVGQGEVVCTGLGGVMVEGCRA